VLSTFDLDECCSAFWASRSDSFHLRNWRFVLLDKQSQELYVRSQIGWDEGQDKHRLSLGRESRELRRSRNCRFIAPDVSQDGALFLFRNNLRGPELAVPLMVNDEVVGRARFQSDRVDHFDRRPSIC